MSKNLLGKLSSIMTAIALLTLGLLANVTPGGAIEPENPSEQQSRQPNYDLAKLFQHIAENLENPTYPFESGHLKKQNRPLTEILDLSPEQSWNSVVTYIAKSDFILSAVYSYRKLSNINLLNRLKMEQSAWKQHILALGGELEDFGKVLVSDLRLGSQLNNLINCHFQITTFMYLKSLTQTIIDIKASDPNFEKFMVGSKEIIENYLVQHDLLAVEL